MKVVLDTNVLVSALIKAGKPRDFFNKLAKYKQIVLMTLLYERLTMAKLTTLFRTTGTLFALKQFKGIRILSVKEMLKE
jgi:predicted nucleic acid-binding protein